MKKKRETQGLEQTTCQNRKTRPENVFRWRRQRCRNRSDELPATGVRRVKATRRNWHETMAARGREFGHATSRGESRSSRRTQPWVRREKWWPKTVADGGRRTCSDAKLKFEFVRKMSLTDYFLYCFQITYIEREYKRVGEGQLFTMTQYCCPLNKVELQ